MLNNSSRFVASNQDVYRISVVNSKGGSGKTTVSTNLSVYLTYKKYKLVLADYDRQKSSYKWLQKRPTKLPYIFGIHNSSDNYRAQTHSWKMSLPQHTDVVVQDTAAGLYGFDLENILKSSNLIVIPVMSSAHDIRATGDCIKEIQKSNAYRAYQPKIFIIANRVNKNSLAFSNLEKFIHNFNLSILAVLSDNKSYSFAAENGVGFHEIATKIEDEEIHEWKKIGAWIEQDIQKFHAKHSKNSILGNQQEQHRNQASRYSQQNHTKDHRTEDQLEAEEEKPPIKEQPQSILFRSPQHSLGTRILKPEPEDASPHLNQGIPSVIKRHLRQRQEQSHNYGEKNPLKAQHPSYSSAPINPLRPRHLQGAENQPPAEPNQARHKYSTNEEQIQPAVRAQTLASPSRRESRGCFSTPAKFHRQFAPYPQRENSNSGQAASEDPQ